MKITKTWLDESFKNRNVDRNLQKKFLKMHMHDVMGNDINFDNNFSIDLKTSKVSNQDKSNYCWIHSPYYLFKEILKKKLNTTQDINISFSHLIFYDKLERMNYNINQLVKYKKKKTWGSKVQNALNIIDHGHNNYFLALVDKYGLVLSDDKEAYSSFNTSMINYVLHLTLVKFDIKMRQLNTNEEIELLVKDTMKQICDFLILVLGKPKKQFSYKYRDINGKECYLKKVKPVSFYRQYLKDEFDDFIRVSSFSELEYNKLYYSSKSNVRYPLKYKDNYIINVDMIDFKKIIINELEKGNMVLSSCVMINGNNTTGVYADNLFDYSILNLDTKVSKDYTFRYNYARKPSHALCISGVDFDKNNNIVKWKFKNSYGEKLGDIPGYAISSDEWFENHCFEISVSKRNLDKKIVEILKQKAQNSDKAFN